MAGVKTPEPHLATAKRIRDISDWGAKIEWGTYAFDDEYATGGEAFTTEGFKSVTGVFFQPKGGYVFDYTGSNKVIAYGQASNVLGALTQIAASVDLSALSDVPYMIVGF